MKTSIVYPLPLDAWETFKDNVQRFCDTWRQFQPGAECTIYAMACGSDPDEEVRKLFEKMPVEFLRYDGKGYDIGAHQHFAFQAGQTFQVNLSTRAYFWKEGWLAKIHESRNYFGPGLFGAAVSNQTGKLHFRTHLYCMESEDFRDYPMLVNSRDRTFSFEHGAFDNPEGTLLQWAMRRPHMAIACVYWDGGWRPNEWFGRPNIFRRGDQSNLLVFDRHSDAYAAASPEEKKALEEELGFPPPPPPPQPPPAPPPPPPARRCCGR